MEAVEPRVEAHPSKLKTENPDNSIFQQTGPLTIAWDQENKVFRSDVQTISQSGKVMEGGHRAVGRAHGKR
jgi:hypothetical protein